MNCVGLFLEAVPVCVGMLSDRDDNNNVNSLTCNSGEKKITIFICWSSSLKLEMALAAGCFLALEQQLYWRLSNGCPLNQRHTTQLWLGWVLNKKNYTRNFASAHIEV